MCNLRLVKSQLSGLLLAALLVPGLGLAAAGDVRNPILPGFNPDPGFLRVGDDYYIVTSSFEHFPVLPVYHSRDLVNWRRLGQVIDRATQMDFSGITPSAGLFSPVMRHHNGTYFLTFTVLRYLPAQRITNYLVTSSSPSGPWSDPIVITDDSFWRIDTSLFFDDDGRSYFTANRRHENNRRMIVLQEIDLKTFRLIGERYDIGSGAWPDSRAAEGSHIYKKDGYYYLLMAEGGTGRGHAVTISRSRRITGPYEQCPHNPILSHRDLPLAEQWVWATGHGEMVQTPQGDWWLAVLGRRGRDVLGRETYLVPMRWSQDQWPVVATDTGRIPPIVPNPGLPAAPWPIPAPRNEFNSAALGSEWMSIRPPAEELWGMQDRPGWLRMKVKPETIVTTVEKGTPSFLAQRLAFHDGQITVGMDFIPRADHEFAGMLLRRGVNTISFGKVRENGQTVIRVQVEEATLTDEDRRRFYAEGLSERLVSGKTRIVLSHFEGAQPGSIHLRAVCRRETHWQFLYSYDGREWHPLGPEIDGSLLGENAPGGNYTGTTVGLYASSQGHSSESHVDFDYFELQAASDHN